MIDPPLPSPARDCVAIRKTCCHSRASGNPLFDFIQIFETLDARFRGHDELRHSLPGERGIIELFSHPTHSSLPNEKGRGLVFIDRQP